MDCSVAFFVRRIRHCTSPNFRPSPAAGDGPSRTEAVEDIFFANTCSRAHQIRTVGVGTECDQIKRVAAGALHAIADPERHRQAERGRTQEDSRNAIARNPIRPDRKSIATSDLRACAFPRYVRCMPDATAHKFAAIVRKSDEALTAGVNLQSEKTGLREVDSGATKSCA